MWKLYRKSKNTQIFLMINFVDVWANDEFCVVQSGSKKSDMKVLLGSLCNTWRVHSVGFIRCFLYFKLLIGFFHWYVAKLESFTSITIKSKRFGENSNEIKLKWAIFHKIWKQSPFPWSSTKFIRKSIELRFNHQFKLNILFRPNL